MAWNRTDLPTVSPLSIITKFSSLDSVPLVNKLVAGNWKMNGSLVSNRALLDAIVPVPGVDVLVCVPFPYLAQAQEREIGIALGAQDVSEYANGAYTGEVSAAMLRDFGCSFVIVGHSERRFLFGERDEIVGRKAAAALEAGIEPIVCVGETLAQRDAGLVFDVIGAQLDATLSALGVGGMGSITIAYEPVWAIGTGRSASAVQVGEVHRAIREWLHDRGVDATRVRILYGGSMKPQNAAELFATEFVDGGLIGGASLVAEDFSAICRAAASH